jgi:hypothetical protein
VEEAIAKGEHVAHSKFFNPRMMTSVDYEYKLDRLSGPSSPSPDEALATLSRISWTRWCRCMDSAAGRFVKAICVGCMAVGEWCWNDENDFDVW